MTVVQEHQETILYQLQGTLYNVQVHVLIITNMIPKSTNIPNKIKLTYSQTNMITKYTINISPCILY